MGAYPDPWEDPKDRAPKIVTYTTIGCLYWEPLKGSFGILPGVRAVGFDHLVQREATCDQQSEPQPRDSNITEFPAYFVNPKLLNGTYCDVRRARSAVEASAASKDERLKNIRDNIAMTTLRSDSSQKALSILTISGKFKQVIDLCNNQGDAAFTSSLATTMTKEEASKVMKAISTRNNVRTRLKVITDVIFKGDWVAMSELKSQIELVEKSCLDCVELLLASQYGEDPENLEPSPQSPNLNRPLKPQLLKTPRPQPPPPTFPSCPNHQCSQQKQP